MNLQENEDGERDFSIELKSSRHLTRLSTSNKDSNGGVLIEGTLGRLLHIFFVEPEILEVKGESGVLRLNVRRSEVASSMKEGLENDVLKLEGR